VTDNRPGAGHTGAMFERDAASQGMGIEVEVSAAGCATATMTVRADMLNGFGVCHGGYLFALADTAFAFACNGGDYVTVAAGATIDFLQPVPAGERLTATARRRSEGGRTGVYDVSVADAGGNEVAIFRGRSHRTSRAQEGA
jgi:acyl-CoA thioesterase